MKSAAARPFADPEASAPRNIGPRSHSKTNTFISAGAFRCESNYIVISMVYGFAVLF
jgi:hypothetical protein